MNTALKTHFPGLEPALVEALQQEAVFKEVAKGEALLNEGQNVVYVPLVLQGMLRIFSRHDDKELLLYYLQPGESCMLSFTAGLRREPSKIFAEVEEAGEILLLPTRLLPDWMMRFPSLSQLYFQQYQHRYEDLVDTIQQLVFNRMDRRVLEYLETKAQLHHDNLIRSSHRVIANDLGTAREVISRVVKKLEREGLVEQQAQGILLLR